MATPASGVLQRVISGGQTGVDIAALRAAKACGLSTGGWMPKGWRTLAGPKPGYRVQYSMREAYSPAYEARTTANVTDADATLLIAYDFGSAGELCTLRAIRALDRAHLDVPFVFGAEVPQEQVKRVADWLRMLAGRFGRPLTLNVAGNSERTDRPGGVESVVETFPRRVFVEVAGVEETDRAAFLSRLPSKEAA